MRDMVEDKELRQLSTCGLVRLARKLGKVFASLPNEIWHVYTSTLKLLDGSRVTMHAIIDNFSRRILAWCVDPTFDVDWRFKPYRSLELQSIFYHSLQFQNCFAVRFNVDFRAKNCIFVTEREPVENWQQLRSLHRCSRRSRHFGQHVENSNTFLQNVLRGCCGGC